MVVCVWKCRSRRQSTRADMLQECADVVHSSCGSSSTAAMNRYLARESCPCPGWRFTQGREWAALGKQNVDTGGDLRILHQQGCVVRFSAGVDHQRARQPQCLWTVAASMPPTSVAGLDREKVTHRKLLRLRPQNSLSSTRTTSGRRTGIVGPESSTKRREVFRQTLGAGRGRAHRDRTGRHTRASAKPSGRRRPAAAPSAACAVAADRAAPTSILGSARARVVERVDGGLCLEMQVARQSTRPGHAAGTR